MKKSFLFLILLALIFSVSSLSNAQPYYYRSGDPSQTANWGNLPDGTGTPPSNFSQTTEYIIGSGKTADVFSAWFFSGNSTLRVIDGGTLINNTTILISPTGSFCLNDGATYVHNSIFNAASFIFAGTEVFAANSNIIIKNWSDAADHLYTGINNTATPYYFGNLEFNFTVDLGNWNQQLFSDTVKWCAGDFKITNTGTTSFCPNLNSSGVKIVILGNFIQNDGTVNLSSSTAQNSLEICRNFYKTGGVLKRSSSPESRIFFNGARVGNSDYQTIYCNDTLKNFLIVKYNTGTGKLRLTSNLCIINLNANAFSLGIDLGTNYFDFGIYKFETNARLSISGNTKFEIGSPYGIDSNLIFNTLVPSQPIEYIYNGTQAQVTGNTLGNLSPDGILSVKKLTINNSFGVTLNRNLIIKDSLEFKAGILNLGNFNLRFDNDYGAYRGVSESRYINTNGLGLLRQHSNGYAAFPIGNSSFTPSSIFYSAPNDTIEAKVLNEFVYAPAYDTSRMVKKCWYLNSSAANVYFAQFGFQWTKNSSDEGKSYNRDSSFTGINHSLTYDPLISTNITTLSIFTSPNSALILPSADDYGSGANPLDLHNRYFVIGNENGVLHQYNYVSGEASDVSNWTDPLAASGLVNPPDFSQSGVYNISNNKTAVFNSPILINNIYTRFRISGNSTVTANAPITCNGSFQLYDSSTYNHNNSIKLSTSLFAGSEYFSAASKFNILQWSDTVDKISDGLNFESGADGVTFGYLTIDFNNLFGLGTWGRNYPSSGDAVLTQGNFHLKRCSGFMLGLGAEGYGHSNLFIRKDLIIGDSLNPVVPKINLSYRTLKSADSAATTLNIGRDLKIFSGGITSDQPYDKARGRFIFNNSNYTHHFYQAPEFFYSMFNLGCANFPNIIEQGNTLVLNSNLYNSTNSAFNLADILEVRGTLDCGMYSIKSTNVEVISYGKVLIKKPSGIDWTLSPIQSLTLEHGSNIEYCGNVPQLTGNSLPDNLAGLNINNSAGVTLTKPVNVTDTLNLYAGKFFTDSANFVTLLNTTRLYNQDSSTGIVGSAAVKCTSSTGFFLIIGSRGPIDEVDAYLQNGDETTFKFDFYNGNPYGQNCLAPLTNVHNNLWFRITRTSAGTPMNASFAFFWGRPLGMNNANNLRIAKHDGTQWVVCGTQGNSGTNESGFVTTDILTSFSPFTIGSLDNQELPVELTSFSSQVNGNKTNLNWTTTTEQNNSGFEIQRAKIGEDSVLYKKIGYVNGYGNSNTVNNYSCEDRNLLSGKYKYRLKQIDFNGNYKYYELANEVIIGVPAKYSLSQNYPNPFNPTTKINYDLPLDSKVSIRIFDMTGREVTSIVNGIQPAGYYTVQFNAGSLSSGTYFYNITAEGGNTKFFTTKKMILVK
jgi:hypothetical protein